MLEYFANLVIFLLIEFQNEMQKHALQDSTSTTTTLKPIQVAVPLAVPDRSTPTSTTTSNTTTTQPTTTSSTTTTPAPTSSSTTVTPTTNATSTTPIPFLVPIVFSDIQFANKTGEDSGIISVMLNIWCMKMQLTMCNLW